MENCTRCNGKGIIETYRHVRAGICFRCWGCGKDIHGELAEARRELVKLRRIWVSLRDRIAADLNPLRAETLLQAQADIEAKGRKAKAFVERLERQFENQRQASRNLA